MKHLSDVELVIQAQKELPYVTIAFEELINRYQSKIYSVCFSVLKDEHLSEDATQNTMLRVFHYLKSFKNESSFFTWVYKISYNESLQIINKNQKFIISQYSDEIEFSYDDIESKVEVDRIMQKLDENEQELLVLKYLLEFKDIEIAEHCNINLSACKMKLKRLKEKINLNY